MMSTQQLGLGGDTNVDVFPVPLPKAGARISSTSGKKKKNQTTTPHFKHVLNIRGKLSVAVLEDKAESAEESDCKASILGSWLSPRSPNLEQRVHSCFTRLLES